MDVDLTALSSTMVFAEVLHMMQEPSDYMGKIIRVRGPYATNFYPPTGLNYHYVVVEDAAACCAQGLEFIWSGEHAAEDYPKKQARIEVVGKFDCYEEEGQTYFYLAVDDIITVEA